MSDPDEAFHKFLAYCHPKCPDMLKGVWWMQDNIDTNQIQTFQDSQWETQTSGMKNSHYNWSTDPTCYGSLGIVSSFGGLRIEVSSDGKWVCFLKPGYEVPQWAYVMQPGDELKRPNGELVPCDEGDLVRMNFVSMFDPTTPMFYQYRLRRVAYYDDSGALVKTRAYDEYVKLAKAPTPHQGCCCNYCLCNLSYAEIAENAEVVSEELNVIYYPAVNDESSTASADLS